jgi:hypothetical protein
MSTEANPPPPAPQAKQNNNPTKAKKPKPDNLDESMNALEVRLGKI